MFQVPVCFTYHLHVSIKVLADYDLQLCACRKRDSCVACVPVCFARGYTPRLHLNMVAELPGNRKLHTGGGTRWYAPYW